jgi:DNA-binding PadR family transcriptional regulator
MERTHGLRHAVLGILARADGGLHGWALKRECEIAFGWVWEINVGRVYRALHRLEAQGFVEPVETADTGDQGRPRKVFRISTRGREELAEFVRDAKASAQWERRDEFPVRFLFSGCVFMSDRSRIIDWERQCCEQRLRAIDRRRRALPPTTRDAALVSLLIDGAGAEIRARLAWLDRTALRLRRVPAEARDGQPRPFAAARRSTEARLHGAAAGQGVPSASAAGQR